MSMCIKNVVKFCSMVLKILSGNEILKSIKGCNSVANLRNLPLYNPNLDIINVNVYSIQNLIKLCHLVLKILSGNEMVKELQIYGITEGQGRSKVGL